MRIALLMADYTRDGDHHDDPLDGVRFLGYYTEREALDARIERIAKANSQYPLRGRYPSWTIGPDEDEGFFGNRPKSIRAVEMR